MPGDGCNHWPLLSRTGRYAITLLGKVVAVIEWDGTSPLNLLLGQVAIRSDILKIGDTAP